MIPSVIYFSMKPVVSILPVEWVKLLLYRFSWTESFYFLTRLLLWNTGQCLATCTLQDMTGIRRLSNIVFAPSYIWTRPLFICGDRYLRPDFYDCQLLFKGPVCQILGDSIYRIWPEMEYKLNNYVFMRIRTAGLLRYLRTDKLKSGSSVFSFTLQRWGWGKGLQILLDANTKSNTGPIKCM